MDEQAEYERKLGRRMIEVTRQHEADTLERWERNRRNNLTATVFAVTAIEVMAFLTPVPLARWSALVIAGCLVVWYWFLFGRPDQG